MNSERRWTTSVAIRTSTTEDMWRDEPAFERDATDESGTGPERLARLVAVRSTSQEPSLAHEMRRYVDDAIQPWLEAMGFSVEVHDNPEPGFGPILFAERTEGMGLSTVVSYGHGDTVRGMDREWTKGAGPWTMARDGDRWYGRGTADNKGQHAINLFALEAVIRARSGRLGLNVRLVLEMAEEHGSAGLREFVAANAPRLGGDVFLGSDGPRVAPGTPTVATGSRGNYRFDLVCAPREGEVNSWHWGGLTTDPTVVVASAIASICDRRGRVLVRELLPARGIPGPVRDLLRGCPVDASTDAARVEDDWGDAEIAPTGATWTF